MNILRILVIVAGLTSWHPTFGQSETYPVTAKPWAFWWWMGSAVSKEGITQNLTDYAQAGFGGLHIIPIYGVKGAEAQFIDFLSPKWMDMLDHTQKEAQRLGLGIDLTAGTGWPFGGPTVDTRFSAKRFVVKPFDIPAGKAFDQFLQTDTTTKQAVLQAVSVFGHQGQYTDFTTKLDQRGRLHLAASTFPRKGFALYAAPTGQMVKRAAPGGEGFVLDYFSQPALQHYMRQFEQAFQGSEKEKVRAFYNDSYEVYGANWTDQFLDEFRQRRGYDLRRHLPALADTVLTEESRRIWSDYHETIADLLLENFTRPWTQWCRERGLITRNQAHGSPGNLLDLYAAADIPETEAFGSKPYSIPGYRVDPDYEESRFGCPNPLAMKFASSAAHLTGKSLVSSETATWLANHFKVSLAQIKPLVDEQFTAGINHVFYHGIPYSPPVEAWPGWLFYASTNFNQQSHFWADLPELNQYITRCQAALQATQPDNDILLYYPIYDEWAGPGKNGRLHFHDVHASLHDWLTEANVGKTGRHLMEQGYSFDYLSDRQLRRLKVDSKRGITTEGKASYRVLLIPACTYLPLATLEALSKLVQQGARVIFVDQLPKSVPGFHRYQKQQAVFARHLTQLDRLRIPMAQVEQKLEAWKVARETLSDQGLQFIRKRHPEGKLYFITNLSNQFRADSLQLSTDAESVEFYDAMAHVRGMTTFRRTADRKIRLFLQLLPGESILVKTYNRKLNGKPWSYYRPSGEAQAVSGNWNIQFIDGKPQLPGAYKSPHLVSWTESVDSTAQWFSGTARYTIQFALPADFRTGQACMLDLGDVREAARVRLNGRDLGKTWSLPFKRQVPSGLLRSTNTLEVEVTNLSANRIRKMDQDRIPWRHFYDINLVDIQYRPFDAAGWRLVASGLLGPVSLTPIEWQESEPDVNKK
jgi:hypothetical protein